MKVKNGFNASLYQVRMGYKYLRGMDIPGNLPFDTAGCGLVRDFGLERVKAILTGIPNDGRLTDDEVLALARTLDPKAE